MRRRKWCRVVLSKIGVWSRAALLKPPRFNFLWLVFGVMAIDSTVEDILKVVGR